MLRMGKRSGEGGEKVGKVRGRWGEGVEKWIEGGEK